MSSLMGLEPCGFLYTSPHVYVCACLCMFVTHSHTNTDVVTRTGVGQHQLVCASNVHISSIVTLSFFSLSLTRIHKHTHTHTHRQMLPPPGVPPSSAWYLANSFIGPGARLSDHNVMWMLISADVVQFGMGDAIAPHLWLHWSQVIVQYTFMGLILNHIVGSYWPTRAINLACDADFYWNVNTASRCCAENGGDTERKRVMWLHASHEITY